MVSLNITYSYIFIQIVYSAGFESIPNLFICLIMAEERDDVLSLGISDKEGSAVSDFLGFEPEEPLDGKIVKTIVPSGEFVSSEKTKNSKGQGKPKPGDSKKAKVQMEKK